MIVTKITLYKARNDYTLSHVYDGGLHGGSACGRLLMCPRNSRAYYHVHLNPLPPSGILIYGPAVLRGRAYTLYRPCSVQALLIRFGLPGTKLDHFV